MRSRPGHRLRFCWVLPCCLLAGCLLLHHPVKAQPAKTPFDKKIDSTVKALPCPAPSEQMPVTMNAALVKDPVSGEMAVLIKALIAPGWHLYAYVPSDMPYIKTECLLDLPPGLTAAGGWQKSPSSPSATDQGVFIWEKEAIFVQRLQPGKTDTGKMDTGKMDKGRLRTGLSYQTCDLRQCLPPAEKWFELEF